MHTFIDESGVFAVSSKMPSPSVVGALVLPDHRLDEIYARYAKLRAKIWKRGGEVKGKNLDEKAVGAVVDILRRNGALFDAVVVEMAMHTEAGLAEHRAGLVSAMMKNVTDDSHPDFRANVMRMKADLDAMKIPGYVQSVLNFSLLPNVHELSINYWSQRVPKELSQFRWVVDGKEPFVDATPWEKWWSTLLLPHMQAQSLKNPVGFIRDGDWSYYERFLIEEVPDYLRPYINRDEPLGTDLRKVFGNIIFSTHTEPGLELVDIVTNGLRRALIGNLGRDGWLGIRDLMLPNRRHAAEQRQSVRVLSLNGTDPPPMLPYTRVINEFAEGGRSMLAPRFY